MNGPGHDPGHDPGYAPTYDPAEWTPAIERAFFDRLLRLPAPGVGRRRPVDVEERIRARLADLEGEVRHLVHTEMDTANVRFTLLAVAAFEILEPVCGSREAADVVDDCLNGPLREQVLAGTAAMLDQAPDPFAVLVAASKERETSYFGPSFRFERPVDDRDTYILEITRCLFHETLAATGHRQLQPVLCRFDLNWADAVDAERHHLRFVRPVTFATGEICRMCFLRLERPDGP